MLPTKEEWLKALENRQGKEILEKFQNATVAICGLGGLGSNIAISLARAGIGKLILIDFDKVDVSNLHRQQYKMNQIGMFKTEALISNLKEISPYTKYEIFTTKISEDNYMDLLKEADVICEAFDNPEAKAMLVNNVLEHLPESYLIAASGMAGMDTPNIIKTRKIMKHFYLCGDEKNDVNNSESLISARVMLCASHEALTVLRIIAEKYEV